MTTESFDGDRPVVLRKLTTDDLAAVIATDRLITGRGRHGYFERRLAAALRDPPAHIQLAADRGSKLIGYVLARVLTGEYGQSESAVALEVIGLADKERRRGTGRRLLAALEQEARRREIGWLQTEADWRAHEMLGFLDAGGFTLAPRLILQCAASAARTL